MVTKPAQPETATSTANPRFRPSSTLVDIKRSTAFVDSSYLSRKKGSSSGRGLTKTTSLSLIQISSNNARANLFCCSAVADSHAEDTSARKCASRGRLSEPLGTGDNASSCFRISSRRRLYSPSVRSSQRYKSRSFSSCRSRRFLAASTSPWVESEPW